MTYDKKSGGDVLMGNNTPCKIVGISSVLINMHDGIVRTLTNVRHVPELNKNLISVGAMDLKCFTCCVGGGVMQIIGRGKSVVMQGTE